MAFGVPYQDYMQPPGGYYGMQPPAPDYLAQLRQGGYAQPPARQQEAQNLPIIWVQGEAGAKAYIVAKGNSVLLMDSETSTFYIKSTDSAGMPQPLRIFDYTERTAAQKQPAQAVCVTPTEYVTRAEFDELKSKIMAQDKPQKKAEVKDNEQPVI